MTDATNIQRLSRILDIAVKTQNSLQPKTAAECAEQSAFLRLISEMETLAESNVANELETIIVNEDNNITDNQEELKKKLLNIDHAEQLKAQIQEQEVLKLEQKALKEAPGVDETYHGYPNCPETPLFQRKINERRKGLELKKQLDQQTHIKKSSRDNLEQKEKSKEILEYQKLADELKLEKQQARLKKFQSQANYREALEAAQRTRMISKYLEDMKLYGRSAVDLQSFLPKGNEEPETRRSRGPKISSPKATQQQLSRSITPSVSHTSTMARSKSPQTPPKSPSSPQKQPSYRKQTKKSPFIRRALTHSTQIDPGSEFKYKSQAQNTVSNIFETSGTIQQKDRPKSKRIFQHTGSDSKYATARSKILDQIKYLEEAKRELNSKYLQNCSQTWKSHSGRNQLQTELTLPELTRPPPLQLRKRPRSPTKSIKAYPWESRPQSVQQQNRK